ncbi:hypothetical protein ACJW30_10G010000 [Castanea mollissima]
MITAFLSCKENANLLERGKKYMQCTRLFGGHFRMINEKLYTCSGKEALDYFKDDPTLFDVYPTRYQEQMSLRPEQEVNIIMKWLMGHNPSLNVADFGCGDARLAKNVQNKVFSFDLVTNDPSVIVCDMSKECAFI